MILISGATGNTGRAVIEFLLVSGIPVRAIVRDPAKWEALRAHGMEVVTGDLRDRSLLARAFDEVQRAMPAQEMLGFGVPAWNADSLLDLFALIRQDRNARITSDFAETTGRMPRTLREFVRDHLDRFTPPGATPAA